LQSKELVLLRYEILYSDGLNRLSKLLNNFFMLKSCGILNFIFFLSFLAIFKLFLKTVLK
jgi:hypothetical protein